VINILQSFILLAMHLMRNQVDQLLQMKQTKLFQAVLSGFKKSLDDIFDSLPADVYVALLLDPRY
jgi:hypothetical protein